LGEFGGGDFGGALTEEEEFSTGIVEDGVSVEFGGDFLECVFM